MGDSSQIGTWTCFCLMAVIMDIGNLFNQSLLHWKRRSFHSATDRQFCAENIVHGFAQSHWAECPDLQKMPVAPVIMSNELETALLLWLVGLETALLRALCPVHLTLIFSPQVV